MPRKSIDELAMDYALLRKMKVSSVSEAVVVSKKCLELNEELCRRVGPEQSRHAVDNAEQALRLLGL